jgi:hypothetical protein
MQGLWNQRRNGIIETDEKGAGDAADRTVSRCISGRVSLKAQPRPEVKGAGRLFTRHKLT